MAGNRPENTVIEGRSEHMASHLSLTRQGFFLNPSVTNNVPLHDLPSPTFRYTMNYSAAITLNVKFKEWQTTYRAWDEWVLHMEPRFGDHWKDLGIYDAIKNSALCIIPDQDIVLALANKWFPNSSTFVFKWGELSVTLEDIRVLGGYPATGKSIFLAPDPITREMIEMDNKLTTAREAIRLKPKQVPINKWIDYFRGGVNVDLEHVGFLVFWLSNHVFPKGSNVVGKHVHYIAMRLHMGARITFGPAVLATIYRDLTTLKGKISALFSSNSMEFAEKTEIWGPMQLVQIWAWKRFAALKP